VPTSLLYDSTRAHLAQVSPHVLARRLGNPGDILVGVFQGMSSHLANIVHAMLRDTAKPGNSARASFWTTSA